MTKSITKTLYLYLFILVLTPFFWQLLINSQFVIHYWLSVPDLILTQFKALFSAANLKTIEDMRWATDSLFIQSLNKIFFNKLTLVFNYLFSYFYSFKPLLYFQSGDGSLLTPPHTEPFPILLLPLSLLGIYQTILSHQKKLLFFFLLSGLPALLTSNFFFPFLLPIALFYLYFAVRSLKTFNPSVRFWVLLVIIFYSVFLLAQNYLIV